MNPLIIGIGNEHRCDDAVGILVVKKISSIFNNIDTAYCLTPFQVMEEWENREKVFIVDALFSKEKNADLITHIHLKDIQENKFSKISSSHSMDILQVILLADSLKILPPFWMIYGVLSYQFSLGNDLSSLLNIDDISLKIIKEIKKDLCMK